MSKSKNRELLKGDSEGLLRLPTDVALVEDPNFRPYVELYARVLQITLAINCNNSDFTIAEELQLVKLPPWLQDEEAFFSDYAESHKKLSELGFTTSSSGSGVASKLRTTPAKLVFRAAFVAAIVLAIYFDVYRKMKWSDLDSPWLYEVE